MVAPLFFRSEYRQEGGTLAFSKGGSRDKLMGTDVSSVYLHVVEDVINNVRADFQSEGVDEVVLNELQQLWELKLMHVGAIENLHEKNASSAAASAVTAARTGLVPPTPVHDLNVPYQETEDYEAPTAEMLFPPTPSLVSTPEPVMYQYMPPSSTEVDSSLGLKSSGRPDPYMQQPASWMNQKPRVDVNLAPSEEGEEEEENGHENAPVTKDFFTTSSGKRKWDDLNTSYVQGTYIPQRDGVGDIGLELYSSVNRTQGADDTSDWNAQKVAGRNLDPNMWKQDRMLADARLSTRLAGATHTAGSSDIPQVDGINDDYDDAVAEEDYNEPGEEEAQTPAAEIARPVKAESAAESEGSEPPLNEDDDDDQDENDQGDEEPTTEHLVLAQFDKVTRSKNKWKCMLKDGIMHLNGKDILFVKANGEFEF